MLLKPWIRAFVGGLGPRTDDQRPTTNGRFSGAARDGERSQEVEEHLVSFEPF